MDGLPIKLPGLYPSAKTIEQIVQQFGPQAYAQAYRMTGTQVDAEDVVQEVFFKLCRSSLLLGPRRNLGAWLRRVVTTTSIDLLRARKSRAAKERGVDTEQVEAASGDQPQFDPRRAVQNRELRERLEAAIQELTPLQIACLVLFDHQGMKGKEIAGILGIDENAVRAHLFKARHKIRELLRAYFDEDPS